LTNIALHLLTCMQVPCPCTQQNLQILTSLSNLQSLCVTAPGAEMLDLPSTPELRQFPGRLTCLTELQLPIEVVQDVSSISECVNLRDLHLHAAIDVATVELTEDEWCSSRLTCLKLEATIGPPNNDDEEAFHGVLRQLRGLRVVGAPAWTSAALPVLQSLTNITAVYGGWDLRQGVLPNGLVCPHIRELGKASGSIPWQMLTNLTSITLEHVFAEHLQALCSCCSGLQKLVLCQFPDPYVRMEHAEYVSAFASLAKLQHLTHLELSALNDAELMAFTSATAATTQHLQYLLVIAPPALPSLLHLLKVKGLRELSLHVRHDSSIPFDDVCGLIVGLSHVPEVSLVLCTEQQRGIVMAARQWATGLGLLMPAVLRVSVCAATRH
jgi:hypothetical protein